MSRHIEEIVTFVARQLLQRTGVVFRKTVAREKQPLPWRDLLRALRKTDTVSALATELAPARGAHTALDRLVTALPARVEEMATEIEARRLAQDGFFNQS